jgi:hypothetical protein
MPKPKQPRYPVYIPTKGRADKCITARFLLNDGVDFSLVVEPQEKALYMERFQDVPILVLPFTDQGLHTTRNWIKDHATDAGYKRHWQLDDNITRILRRHRGRRFPCNGGIAMAVIEDFTDRYENIAVAGMNYEMFAPTGQRRKPFQLNCHVYSCSLVNNEIPHRWRYRLNDDTDFCLQVLSDGWCTVLVNAFLVSKVRTMVVKGGNTDAEYQGDGRLRMARSLERVWPGVARTGRRYQRPQHIIKGNWKHFDTPLKLRDGIDLSTMKQDEYGMTLEQVKPIKNDTVRLIMEEYQEKRHGD